MASSGLKIHLTLKNSLFIANRTFDGKNENNPACMLFSDLLQSDDF